MDGNQLYYAEHTSYGTNLRLYVLAPSMDEATIKAKNRFRGLLTREVTQYTRGEPSLVRFCAYEEEVILPQDDGS